MKAKLSAAVIVFCSLLIAAPTARAHHSFCAEFDATKPYVLTGTVSQVEWKNPHVWVYLLVKNAKGGVEQWLVTTATAPRVLEGRGWTKDLVQVGDELTVQGALAKDGSKRGGLGKVVFKGKTIYEGHPAAC